MNQVKHGSPYDRGRADAYYRRGQKPHWYPEGTYHGLRIGEEEMTEEEIAEYRQGYEDAMEFGDHKEWE